MAQHGIRSELSQNSYGFHDCRQPLCLHKRAAGAQGTRAKVKVHASELTRDLGFLSSLQEIVQDGECLFSESA